jgi:hypothetical protein
MTLMEVSDKGFMETYRTQKRELSQKHSQIAVFAV